MSQIITVTYWEDQWIKKDVNTKDGVKNVSVCHRVFKNVLDEKGSLLAENIIVSDGENYKKANLQKNKKYRITCSNATWQKIERPSRVLLIVEPDEDDAGIQFQVSQYKENFIDAPKFMEMMTNFSNRAMAHYIKSVVDKANSRSTKHEAPIPLG
jgi:hypothetical protein